MTQKTVIIANRGEIACRIIRAAKTLSLRTVAVFSDADEHNPHVTMADTAIRIGPAKAADSYLNQSAIIDAAKQSGATLLHPGYGFLSENASFAKLCEENGIGFIGPQPDVMALMGDKERARSAAQAAGVSVLPGSSKLDIHNVDAILVQGQTIGFPLLVKAAAGGGGIGMRLVNSAADLHAAVAASSSLADKAFGDGSVYLEKFIDKARHVEIQIFGFGDGTAVHMFERDCSLQRRHQKVIEEAPAPGLKKETRDAMGEAAVALAQACRYKGAGTIEFLFDVSSQDFYFLEMNTRIQVEHPVTEMITGIDIVAMQIRLALGEEVGHSLKQSHLHIEGHAIEARVYAENPAKNFIPSPGTLTRLVMPARDNVRYETGYAEGNRVTPFYDPMVMKIIAWGKTRTDAARLLHDTLMNIQLEGIKTNIEYLVATLENHDFLNGDVYTNFLAHRHNELLSACSAASA